MSQPMQGDARKPVSSEQPVPGSADITKLTIGLAALGKYDMLAFLMLFRDTFPDEYKALQYAYRFWRECRDSPAAR
jgi:hypothetical protein